LKKRIIQKNFLEPPESADAISSQFIKVGRKVNRANPLFGEKKYCIFGDTDFVSHGRNPSLRGNSQRKIAKERGAWDFPIPVVRYLLKSFNPFVSFD
jgi:hypothetical protein